MLSVRVKHTLICVHDVIFAALSAFLACWLQFSFSHVYAMHEPLVLGFFIAAVIVQPILNSVFGVYRGYWRFVSILDLQRIIKAVFVTTVALLLIDHFLLVNVIPWESLALYGVFTVFFLGGGRLAYRLMYSYDHEGVSNKKRVLVVGSGQTAEYLIRDMSAHKGEYSPVAIVDNDPDAQKREIHGVRVRGKLEQIPVLLAKYALDMVVIATSQATSKVIKEVFDYCDAANVPLRTVPSIHTMMTEGVQASGLREISIEDLLGRDQVKLDWTGVSKFIGNKKILVTGGGGSIGSQLCRQIAEFGPSELVIVDHSEYNLYAIERELKDSFPSLKLHVCLASVTDEASLRDLFSKHPLDVVFHAAAYKHVPLLENQPSCAIRNNAIGTRRVASLASEFKVSHFVLISTDKAVMPCNVMGATKRLCEMICQYYNTISSTKYMAVRFGNVLGSVGSVVPLFKQQIKAGGPITVTHLDTTRYFMMIPEAAQLILQASHLGHGGELFVLDMGTPIKIIDLADQMLKLMGAEKEAIGIKVVGLRPGERLHEDLFYDDEALEKTMNAKIFRTQGRAIDFEGFDKTLDALEAACLTLQDDRSLKLLKESVGYDKDNDIEAYQASEAEPA
jgi:FlaA1/EpsC-like NDP-sugar epimerase